MDDETVWASFSEEEDAEIQRDAFAMALAALLRGGRSWAEDVDVVLCAFAAVNEVVESAEADLAARNPGAQCQPTFIDAHSVVASAIVFHATKGASGVHVSRASQQILAFAAASMALNMYSQAVRVSSIGGVALGARDAERLREEVANVREVEE